MTFMNKEFSQEPGNQTILDEKVYNSADVFLKM